MITSVVRGFVLTAECELKAMGFLSISGLLRLIAEPSFYSLFVVTALAAFGGGVDPQRAGF